MDIVEFKLKNNNTNRHPWELAKLKVIYDIIRSITPEIDLSKSTILDVGCGDLFLMKDLASRYEQIRLAGVDSSFDENVIGKIGIESIQQEIVLANTIEEVEKKIACTVDLVFLLDVIEHVENDIGFLKMLQNSPLISGNTYFIITAPAYNFLFCSHDKLLGHFRRYSNTLLKFNTETAGLQTIDSGYFFFLLLFPRISQKFVEMVVGSDDTKQKGVSSWKGSNHVTEFITAVLYCDYKIGSFIHKALKLRLPGLSNYIVCKKRPA